MANDVYYVVFTGKKRGIYNGQNVKNKSLDTKEMCISRTKLSKKLDGLGCSMNHIGTIWKTHLRQTLEMR